MAGFACITVSLKRPDVQVTLCVPADKLFVVAQRLCDILAKASMAPDGEYRVGSMYGDGMRRTCVRVPSAYRAEFEQRLHDLKARLGHVYGDDPHYMRAMNGATPQGALALAHSVLSQLVGCG